MADYAHDFHAAFLNICSGTDCTAQDWIQTGPFEGHFGTMAPTSVVHRYIETNTGCGYQSIDFGAPSAANAAYFITYVSRDELPGFLNCGNGFYYKWAVRFGSVTSAPVGYFYLLTASGIPIAEEEVFAPNAPESLNTDFFGVNNSLGADISFGLHVHTSSGWLLWTAANVPSSGGWSNSPPYRTNLATFYSFKVTD